MRPREFMELVQRRQEECLQVLEAKAKEYATGEDRLANFRRAAGLLGVSLEEALMGMLVKHWVSLAEMVASRKSFAMGKWAEKITDAINYLYLLEACLVDQLASVLHQQVERAGEDKNAVEIR